MTAQSIKRLWTTQWQVNGYKDALSSRYVNSAEEAMMNRYGKGKK